MTDELKDYMTKGKWHCIEHEAKNYCQVIGNIYGNPELLKGEEL